MERSKIPMLSRFDTISHIMPYYGQTHRAFLLLSSLCSETRDKLDEFYNEFVTNMKEYWRHIEVYSNFQKFGKSIPNDLFEVFIEPRNQEIFDAFIEFIENLRDSKGCYFNCHYMHSKIKIRDPICVDVSYLKELFDYDDVLKTTQVILCKEDIHNFNIHYEPSTLDTNWNYVLLILMYNMQTNFILVDSLRILILSIFYFKIEL